MAKKAKGAPARKRNVRPDRIDFRDLPFRPNVAVAPKPRWFPEFALPVKNQEDTSACTGFSLSLVVEHLLRKAQREKAPAISPYMLYSMARRYDERGFLLQNSWDTDWGSYGYAILTYDDWLDNAMDCWVAQLGVVTQEHQAISRATTLRTDPKGRVALASSTVLRDREISPFVLNMGNNGRLSSSGLFRTGEDDVRAIVDIHLAEARKRWQLEDQPIDVCVYAHGGLVGEKDAAANAAEWIPMLYERQIFPIYLMWETDFFSTVINRISDAVRDVPRPAGAGEGFWSKAEEDDPTCGPYKRSLLYLVSQSFEAGRQTPILGMQKYFDPYAPKLKNATVHASPGATSTSTTHGGFDNDPATKARVVEFIKGAG
jgi:hypothetical protein